MHHLVGGSVDIGGGCERGGGVRGIWEISVLSAQFGCEPQSDLVFLNIYLFK